MQATLRLNMPSQVETTFNAFTDAQNQLETNNCGLIDITLKRSYFENDIFVSDAVENDYSIIKFRPLYNLLCEIPNFEALFSQILKASPLRILGPQEFKNLRDETFYEFSKSELSVCEISRVLSQVALDFPEVCNLLESCLSCPKPNWSKKLGTKFSEFPAIFCLPRYGNLVVAEKIATDLMSDVYDEGLHVTSLMPRFSQTEFVKTLKSVRSFLNLLQFLEENSYTRSIKFKF